MKRTRLIFAALPVAAAALSLIVPGFGQNVVSPPGKFFPSAEWKKMIDDDKPAAGAIVGQTARLLPPETFVIRRRVAGPNNASVHSKAVDGAEFSEIYYIIEGTGELVTGGTYNPKDRTAGIKGGDRHSFKPGDILVVPMGTAHWFSKINGQVTYIQARYPGNVLETSKQ